MGKKAFDKIKAGLDDALAFAQGDKSKGKVNRVIGGPIRKKACVRITIEVEFEDDGVNDLRDQAIEAAADCVEGMIVRNEADMEIVGEVEDAD